MNWEQHKATVVAAIDNAFRADPNDGIATLSVVEAILCDLKEIRSTREQAEKLSMAADERRRYLDTLWSAYTKEYSTVLAAAKTVATGTTVSSVTPISDDKWYDGTYMTDQSGVI